MQTCLRGRVDPTRIWVQVKGTGRDRSDESKSLPSLSLKADQLLRWARTSDLVIVVLWDVVSNCGWYVLPQGMYDHMYLADRGTGRISLKFDRSQRFDLDAAERLAWETRLVHADRHLQEAVGAMGEPSDDSGESDSGEHLDFSRSAAAALLFDVALDLGLFEQGGGLTKGFMDAIVAGARRVGGTEREKVTRAVLWAIVKTTHENTAKNGIPQMLLVELMSAVVEMVFRDLMDELELEELA